MKKSESMDDKAAELAERLCSGSNVSKILEDLSDDAVQDLSTNILRNGHTVLHILAQRQKLQALQTLLQHKGGAADIIHTRNAQGATPLLVALQHNALFSAKVLLDFGANPSEVVSRQKGTSLLHLMVTCDRPHAVMLLLQEGAEPNARDWEGHTPFHLAAIYGNAVIAAILMRHEDCDVNAVDASGHTAVMLAIINKNQELARQLVEAPGVDIVQRDKDGMSCLHLAVSLGQLEVVRSLLRRNTANINSKEHRMGRTPIYFACTLRCGVDGIITTNCLPAGEDTTISGGDGGGGVVNGNDGGAQSNARAPGSAGSTNTRALGSAGSRPSLVAAKTSFDDFPIDSVNDVVKVNIPPISVSLSNKTNSRFQNNHSPQKNLSAVNGLVGQLTPRTPRTPQTPRTPRTPSTSITPRARTPVRTPRTSTPRPYTPRQLYNQDSSFGETTPGHSPRRKTKTSSTDSSSLRHSISGDQVASTPRPKSYLIQTPLKARQSMGSASTIRSQRPSTAPIFNNLHRHFNSTFPTSLITFKIPTASTGRESALSHRSQDSTTVTVTPFNIGMIRCKLVALLLDHDADANLMTTFRKSPLHVTSILGAADVMALLVPHITNFNVLSASNKTALHLAVEGGFTSIAAQLINAGANLMMRDISGMTALHMAAKLGHTDIASLLLKAKVDKNSCDFQQRMPLHHACLHNHTQIIDLLLKAGACLDRADDDGFLPLQYKEKYSTDSAKTFVTQVKTSITEKPGPQPKLSSTPGPQPKFSNTSAKTGNIPADSTRSLMPQRRRKMGVIQSTNVNSVPAQRQAYQKEPSPMVLYSVVAL